MWCQSTLGRRLGEMHKAAKSEKGFGFYVDNTIGRFPTYSNYTLITEFNHYVLFILFFSTDCLLCLSCCCSTPQINKWTSDWIKFYGEHRLGYQLKLALKQYGDSRIYEKGCFIAHRLSYIEIDILAGIEEGEGGRGLYFEI